MSYTRQMLDTFSRAVTVDADLLAAAIDAMSDCAPKESSAVMHTADRPGKTWCTPKLHQYQPRPASMAAVHHRPPTVTKPAAARRAAGR